MKTKISLSFILILIIVVIGCSNESVSTLPNIEYLSFESLGCYKSDEALLKENGGVTFDWEYKDNNLTISTLFTTHCSAVMSDSVVATDEKIEIFLCDTCRNRVAKCICPYKEVFLFSAESPKKIEVILHYKPATEDIFYELGQSTIEI